MNDLYNLGINGACMSILISLISITGPLNLIDNNSPQNSKAYLDVCFSDDLFVPIHGEN